MSLLFCVWADQEEAKSPKLDSDSDNEDDKAGRNKRVQGMKLETCINFFLTIHILIDSFLGFGQ